jgi:AcrR family transcriptional regulator
MSTETRRYELKARAERQAQTRARIVEATAQLHEEVGPARTTVAEIARRAGVQRLTVYNHFPEMGELFAACQGRWLELHPRPDLAPALALPEPEERLWAVLAATYGWYRETERMGAAVRRDRKLVPELDALLARTADAAMAQLGAALSAGFRIRGERARRVAALVDLALTFATWQTLAAGGLGDEQAAATMTQAIAAAVSA